MKPQRRKRQRSGIDRSERREYPRYRQWIRGFDCCVADTTCRGGIQAAHVRAGVPFGAGGIGLKPHDCWCLPMCEKHHSQAHREGEPAFWKGRGDPVKIALQFALRHDNPHQAVKDYVRENMRKVA